ncbi:uncharacterized protein EV154DRAFT_510037 [Mucor mucedo]|uniref:uncharacterized protein n=1 Tax=Mucor mucedo TaxID=29922 RepID=UPI00221FEF9D|nr:uncharacterized protein EV154DRAFT_510037 [Mucor mucedo]KAI7890936.1 hypothetical protein EV154DRAFT_510037 [Mucor mucedo]
MMTEQVSLQAKLKNLVQQRQFYWWLGHVCVVCNGLFYFSSVLSLNTNESYYKRAYLGALLSYAVVIYNSIGVTHTTIGMNLLCDENVHYFVIAFYWYSYQPITVTLIPFFVFSIFHTLTYTKSTLLPLLCIPITSQIESKIQHFTDNYHTTAMNYVAYVEVIGILGRLILGIITFRTSVLALIVFVHFLRLRYFLSSYTRDALETTGRYLDTLIILPENKSTQWTVVSNLYISLRRLIIRYGGGSGGGGGGVTLSNEKSK